MKIAITAIAAVAGVATASPYMASVNESQVSGHSAPAGAIATMTIDISGVESWDALGGANTVLNFNIGANAHVIGFGFDATIVTQGGSWISEARIALTDSGFTTGVLFGLSGTNSPGTEVVSSGGIMDLATVNPTVPLDFFVDADGIARVEFYESWDDDAGVVDAVYGAGSQIQIQYIIPAPGALAMLGLGGLVAGRRRR